MQGETDVTKVFSQEQLTKIIDSTIPPDLKPGEKVVIGAVDLQGAQVVASFKKGDHVMFQAAARHDWTGDNQAGAKVILRW